MYRPAGFAKGGSDNFTRRSPVRPAAVPHRVGKSGGPTVLPSFPCGADLRTLKPMNAASENPTPWVVDTTAERFELDVVERSQLTPVVVDFWAAWCQPCRHLAPLLEKLATEYAGRFIVVRANTDELPHIAAQFNIQSIPTVFAPGGRAGRRFLPGIDAGTAAASLARPDAAGRYPGRRAGPRSSGPAGGRAAVPPGCWTSHPATWQPRSDWPEFCSARAGPTSPAH